jgi:metal-responsive CopG/Arc/MetJ family transcriptional regulator
MAKKMIQVPVDEDLLEALDQVSLKLRESRSEIIRQACKRYLLDMKDEEMDRLYQQGYRDMPEEAELGEMQISVLSQVLPAETW